MKTSVTRGNNPNEVVFFFFFDNLAVVFCVFSFATFNINRYLETGPPLISAICLLTRSRRWKRSGYIKKKIQLVQQSYTLEQVYFFKNFFKVITCPDQYKHMRQVYAVGHFFQKNIKINIFWVFSFILVVFPSKPQNFNPTPQRIKKMKDLRSLHLEDVV